MSLDNVLYVDNKPLWVSAARRVLKQDEFALNVDTAIDAESAIKRIRKKSYDLVILDGLEGECFAVIKDVTDIPHGAIVIFTTTPQVIARASELKITCYNKLDGLSRIMSDYRK